MIAVGAGITLREASLVVPDDISLACIDDIPLASLLDPFLTAAVQPAYEIGWQAARLALGRIDGTAGVEPQEVVLPPELIVRRSCARPADRG